MHYLHKPIYSLLLVLMLFTSCSGQVKTNSSTGSLSKLEKISTGQPKLVKTQGANEYQSVVCGLQDKKGNLWFGTTEEGVYRFDGKMFTQFTIKDGLSSNAVWSVLEDKAGNIWFGTTDGICRFNGKNIVVVPINYFTRPVITNNNYYTESSTKNTVWSMLQDKSGKIWFGTGDGVYCYEEEKFTRFLANDNIINKDSLQLKVVSNMLEDSNGDVWFASGMPPGSEGLCHFDGKMIERFKPKNQGWIRHVTKSKNGNLLLATRNAGLLSYDGKSFTGYTQPKELINGSLQFVLEDRAGNLWIVSDYGNNIGDTLGGLWRSNLSADNTAEKSFTKITNQPVYCVFEDKDNNIWLGTRGTGLYRYDGKALTKFSE